MATISLAPALTANTSPQGHANVKRPYMVWKEVDLAAAVTAKGSALAQGDVIEVVRIPAGSILLGGFAKKTAAMTGTSTDLTFDVGVTGGDVDVLVDGWDFDAAAVNAVNNSGVQTQTYFGTSDTIDILFATQTGTVTGGKVVVGVILQDIEGITASRQGLAQPKS